MSVQAAKKHLTQRMEKLNDKLDEQKEVTGAIKFEVCHFLFSKFDCLLTLLLEMISFDYTQLGQ